MSVRGAHGPNDPACGVYVIGRIGARAVDIVDQQLAAVDGHHEVVFSHRGSGAESKHHVGDAAGRSRHRGHVLVAADVGFAGDPHETSSAIAIIGALQTNRLKNLMRPSRSWT